MTLGEEGARTLQEMLLSPPPHDRPRAQPGPGKWESWSHPKNHKPFCAVAAALLLSPVAAAALPRQASAIREP